MLLYPMLEQDPTLVKLTCKRETHFLIFGAMNTLRPHNTVSSNIVHVTVPCWKQRVALVRLAC